jgi:DNA-binding MarR family transcriptional regulator
VAGLNELNDIDRVIHEPARLMLTAMLSAVESADFTFLMNESGLTRGNLSSHLSKLEEAGYVSIEKGFRGKYPQTLVSLTDKGRAAFKEYRSKMKAVMEN